MTLNKSREVRKKKAIVFTSFGSISTSGVDCLLNILYCGSIVEQKAGQDVINAIENEMCLGQACPAAVGLGLVKWHVEVATRAQSVRLFAAAVNLRSNKGGRNKLVVLN